MGILSGLFNAGKNVANYAVDHPQQTALLLTVMAANVAAALTEQNPVPGYCARKSCEGFMMAMCQCLDRGMWEWGVPITSQIRDLIAARCEFIGNCMEVILAQCPDLANLPGVFARCRG